MTEAEWRAAGSRKRRDAFVALGPRRGRLFGVACCRLLGGWDHPEVVRALEVAEAFADTGRSKVRLRQGRQAVQALCQRLAGSGRADGRHLARRLTIVQAVALEGDLFDVIPHLLRPPPFGDTLTETLRRMHPLYADVAGPPGVAFDPAWRTPTATAIATGAYADRAFDRLPILADALEDAGCDAAELLAHLRGPGPHARGCWALDAVLGKA